jgi:hypothetical protein
MTAGTGDDPAAAALPGLALGLRLGFSDPLRDERRRILVDLRAVADADLETVLDGVLAGIDRSAAEPVVVVSTDRLAPLVHRRIVYEFLPTHASLAPVMGAGVDDYLAARLSLIRHKWAVDDTVVAGPVSPAR